MTDPLPIFVDPSDLTALVRSLRHRARTLEQGVSCAGCPLGGVPYAMREVAADIEKMARGQKVEGLENFRA